MARNKFIHCHTVAKKGRCMAEWQYIDACHILRYQKRYGKLGQFSKQNLVSWDYLDEDIQTAALKTVYIWGID